MPLIKNNRSKHGNFVDGEYEKSLVKKSITKQECMRVARLCSNRSEFYSTFEEYYLTARSKSWYADCLALIPKYGKTRVHPTLIAAEDHGVLKLAITGHRPDKIGGYDERCHKRTLIRQALHDYFVLHKPTYIITGGALGVDTDAARMAYKLGIPYSVIAPCINHSSKWPPASQISYEKMCQLADKHVIINVPYSGKAMQDRNKAMVDECDMLLAVWDGSKSGTGNCVNYARSVGKPVSVIDPSCLSLCE